MAVSSAGAAGQAGIRKRPQGWRANYQPDRRRAWYRYLLSSPAALIGIGFLALVALAAILAPVIAPHEPTFINPTERLQAPSAAYWFGTDDLGRDVFSRLVYGARVSLLVSASVTILSATAGSILGLLAGYYRRLDGLIMRVMDGLMAFPGVLLAIAVVVSLGAEFRSVVLALVVVYTPVVARLVRSTTLVIRELPYVEGARCVGLPDRTILRRYVLANAVSPLDRPVHLHRRLRDPLRSGALLPRRQHQPRNPHLGQHAPRRPAPPEQRLVDGRRPGSRSVPHGAGLHIIWGRHA